MSPQEHDQIKADEQQFQQDGALSDRHMEPVAGSVEVQIPAEELWRQFRKPHKWPVWNRCFFWVWNRSLQPGDRLLWIFQPIRWWYLYKMPAVARIVEVEPGRKVTWEVTVLPGFHALHTYFIEKIDEKSCRFGSWEKASGWSFRLLRKFWLAHFQFVLRESLQGVRTLEREYLESETGSVGSQEKRVRWKYMFLASALVLLLVIGAMTSWLYLTYLHPEEVRLAPGVTAILNGGSNTLVIEVDDQALIVDPKFPPASTWLRKWVSENVDAPVQTLINTHYHYDHTLGNAEFPGARVISHSRVPDFMQESDPAWWGSVPFALPDDLVETSNLQVQLGATRVTIRAVGPAHTRGDLIVHVDRQDAEIVVTGDLFVNGFYPFFDLSERGSDLAGLIRILRWITDEYPDAIFLPGHGAPGTASEVREFAAYLDHLYAAVRRAAKEGLSESQALSEVKSGQWNYRVLPSFHQGSLCFATATSNVRWTYQLVTDRVPPDHCRF